MDSHPGFAFCRLFQTVSRSETVNALQINRNRQRCTPHSTFASHTLACPECRMQAQCAGDKAPIPLLTLAAARVRGSRAPHSGFGFRILQKYTSWAKCIARIQNVDPECRMQDQNAEYKGTCRPHSPPRPTHATPSERRSRRPHSAAAFRRPHADPERPGSKTRFRVLKTTFEGVGMVRLAPQASSKTTAKHACPVGQNPECGCGMRSAERGSRITTKTRGALPQTATPSAAPWEPIPACLMFIK